MRAGCFGKLPIHSDFIQHNAGGAEIETLYKWFQEGMETVRQRWGNDWESEYRAAPPTRFLFQHLISYQRLIFSTIKDRADIISHTTIYRDIASKPRYILDHAYPV